MEVGSTSSDRLTLANQILVVEDELDVRELIAIHLRRAGHEVTAVNSAEEARGALAARSTLLGNVCFDIIILDWMLPGSSGVDFLREIRKNSFREKTAVLMLTAKGEAKDVVEGLDAGADDYLVKPFDFSVLMARVRALSRRLEYLAKISNFSTSEASLIIDPIVDSRADSPMRFEEIKLGGLSLFPETYEVKCKGEPILLTPSEFKLLMALTKSQGRVLTRDSLISQVQGEGVSVVGRTVDTHVFGLRKKLADCADVIETVRGVGYRVKTDFECN
jgi:DNA-binding response OmpR family regulator